MKAIGPSIWAICLTLALSLAGCKESKPAHPEVRPVRAITVEAHAGGEQVTLTGQVRAQDQAALAFRLDGRMIERKVGVGDHVSKGDLVARLDPLVQKNLLRSAEAALSAAEGQLKQAKSAYVRQQQLLSSGVTTRALFEQAQQAQQSTQAQVDSAAAQLRNAQEQLGFTDLRADSDGSVTAVGAEPGEVVRAGQMVVQLARSGGRDAVFDVPGVMLRAAPHDPQIDVFLSDDANVHAMGRVREVAPQADPATRTFQVKVSLIDPPPAMLLGATVTGRVQFDAPPGVEIPASALTEVDAQPAVWVVNPKDSTVELRKVAIARHDLANVVVSQGLVSGDIVVTAGVQALYPGQKVRLLGNSAS